MPINEAQTIELSKKIEDVIQSTNFALALKNYNVYLYNEVIKQGFEQKNMPSDIKLQDVARKEVKIQNQLSSEAWAELLARTNIHNEVDLQRVLRNREEIIEFMLEHMENRFQIIVEIDEELSEIRERKPDKKTLSNAFANNYEEHTFKKRLEEDKNDVIKERVRETASDEGVSETIPIKEIPYTINVNLTTDFDALAERHLEAAIESENTTKFASENIFKILMKENAYEINVKIDLDRLEG